MHTWLVLIYTQREYEETMTVEWRLHMQRKKIKIAFKLSQNDRNHAASFYNCDIHCGLRFQYQNKIHEFYPLTLFTIPSSTKRS